MLAATRQDVQSVIEFTRNNLVSRMASRGDMQALADQIHGSIVQTLQALHTENRQIYKREQSHRSQILSRIDQLDQDVKGLQQTLSRILEQQTRAMSKLQSM